MSVHSRFSLAIPDLQNRNGLHRLYIVLVKVSHRYRHQLRSTDIYFLLEWMERMWSAFGFSGGMSSAFAWALLVWPENFPFIRHTKERPATDVTQMRTFPSRCQVIFLSRDRSGGRNVAYELWRRRASHEPTFQIRFAAITTTPTQPKIFNRM